MLIAGAVFREAHSLKGAARAVNFAGRRDALPGAGERLRRLEAASRPPAARRRNSTWSIGPWIWSRSWSPQARQPASPRRIRRAVDAGAAGAAADCHARSNAPRGEPPPRRRLPHAGPSAGPPARPPARPRRSAAAGRPPAGGSPSRPPRRPPRPRPTPCGSRPPSWTPCCGRPRKCWPWKLTSSQRWLELRQLQAALEDVGRAVGQAGSPISRGLRQAGRARRPRAAASGGDRARPRGCWSSWTGATPGSSRSEGR